MQALSVLVLAGVVVVPYGAARALWLIPMPAAAKIAIALAVPGVLMRWLATSPDFQDITNLGAAFLPAALIGSWVFGTLAHLRQRVGDRALINIDLDRRRSRRLADTDGP